MAPFDPYHKWLGIPPEDQPPSHYRLLAIPKLESDPDVIDTAAERQTVFLRTFQSGDQAELAEQLLNEVSAARICLLNTEQKAEYDRQLQADIQPAPAPTPAVDPADPLGIGDEQPTPAVRQPSQRRENTQPIWQQPRILAIAGGAVVVILLLVILSSGGDKPNPTASRPPIGNQQPPPQLPGVAVPPPGEGTHSSGETGGQQIPPRRGDSEFAALRFPTGTRIAPLKQGLPAHHDRDKYRWREIPAFLEGLSVTQFDSYQGISEFTAASTGRIWMAVSPRWGGGGGGGPWQNELTTEADLLTFGWNEIGSLEYHDKESLSSLNWSVHERVFSAGESYRIRNEKYLCPVYFFPPDKGAISNDDSVVMLKGHTAGVQSVAFSPDGKWIVSGGVDKTLKVWDAETGEEMLTLQGHSEIVRSVNFSPDGRRIVSGGADKTIKVWDTETGQEMLTLRRHSDRVFSVAFSPDGKRIVSGSSDKTVKVWELGLVASGQ